MSRVAVRLLLLDGTSSHVLDRVQLRGWLLNQEIVIQNAYGIVPRGYSIVNDLFFRAETLRMLLINGIPTYKALVHIALRVFHMSI